MKNIRIPPENFLLIVVKFSVYLNRHVFVMGSSSRWGLFIAQEETYWNNIYMYFR